MSNELNNASQVAAAVATFSNENWEIASLHPLETLADLRDCGLDIQLDEDRQRASISFGEREWTIRLLSFNDVFMSFQDRGIPFLVIDPEHVGAAELHAPAEDEDGEPITPPDGVSFVGHDDVTLTPYVVDSTDELLEVPVIRLAWGHIYKSNQLLVASQSLLAAAAYVLTGAHAGAKFLPENAHVMNLELLEQFGKTAKYATSN